MRKKRITRSHTVVVKSLQGLGGATAGIHAVRCDQRSQALYVSGPDDVPNLLYRHICTGGATKQSGDCSACQRTADFSLRKLLFFAYMASK